MPENKKGTIESNPGSQWYQWTSKSLTDQNRLLMKTIFIQMGVIALLAILSMVLLMTAPPYQVVAVTPDLRVVKLQPMSSPVVNDAAITGFSTKVVQETYSLNFRHWRESLMQVKPYYSDAGFKGIVAALKSSGNLEAIVKRRLITTAAIDGAPIITAQGVYKDAYTWKVKVPVIIEYEGASGVTNRQTLTAVLMISRADLRVHHNGIQIVSLTFVSRSK